MSCPVKIQRFKAAVLSVSLLAFANFFFKGARKRKSKNFSFSWFFFPDVITCNGKEN